jgi:hypothetical protein
MIHHCVGQLQSWLQVDFKLTSTFAPQQLVRSHHLVPARSDRLAVRLCTFQIGGTPSSANIGIHATWHSCHMTMPHHVNHHMGKGDCEDSDLRSCADVDIE